MTDHQIVEVSPMVWNMGSTFDNRQAQKTLILETWKKCEDLCFCDAPFCLNDIMSKRCLNKILLVHQASNTPFTVYKDRFYPVRDILSAWNKNTAANFISSWVVCLDKSMLLWTYMWSCPDFVFCPKKPWPIGNEYYTIMYRFILIIFHMNLVERKDWPSKLGKNICYLWRYNCRADAENGGEYLEHCQDNNSGFGIMHYKGYHWIGKGWFFVSVLIKKGY